MKKIMTILAVVATIIVGGWLVFDNVDQRADLDAANARIAVVTDQRNEAQAEATDAEAEVTDLNSEVSDLRATAEQCSVLPEIANHLLNAAGKMSKATTASIFLKSYYIDAATARLRKVNTLMEASQSHDGELMQVCGANSGTGV